MNAFMSNAGKAIPKVITLGKSCNRAFDDESLLFKGYYRLAKGRFWYRFMLAIRMHVGNTND